MNKSDPLHENYLFYMDTSYDTVLYIVYISEIHNIFFVRIMDTLLLASAFFTDFLCAILEFKKIYNYHLSKQNN